MSNLRSGAVGLQACRHVMAIGMCGLLSACLPTDQPTPAATAETPPALVQLGELLFSDATLSSNADHSGPGGQSCASCHVPAQAFTDPDTSRPVSAGSVAGRFGHRNAPTVAYAAFVPPLSATLEDGDVLWTGGLFLDGRVDSLEAQATQPFLNASEMNNASPAEVVARLRASPSATPFLQVFGADALDPGHEEQAFARIASAIAAYERTPAVSPFSSRFDDYLAGRGKLTAEELEGMAVFVRADKGNCAACHSMARGPAGQPPLFTDFSYDNLGVPRNADPTYFPPDFVDEGLGATLAARGVASADRFRGKFRVPTLRNIARTAPYMHNGVFTSLRQVIEFYSTRDSDPGRWGATEIPSTVNRTELGNLRLSDREINALVAFLQTLNDR